MGHHVRYLTGPLGKQMRPKIVELDHITIRRTRRSALEKITLHIFEGESVALLGSSEEEKYILTACLLGQIQPDSGTIRVLGTQLPPLPPEIRRQIGVMPRQVECRTSETVAHYLQRFSAYHGVQLTHAQVSLYCTRYELSPSRQVAELSRLQARVLALALAQVHDPRLTLLIEPLDELTEQEQIIVEGYLRRSQREGRTLLCICSENSIPTICDKVISI